MKSIHTIRLKLALPLLVIGSCSLLLLLSIVYQHQQTLNSIEVRALEDVQRVLITTKIDIETLLQHDQQALVGAEIASHGQDANIKSLALLDATEIITQATQPAWIGRSLQHKVADFSEEQYRAAQNSGELLITFSADRQRLLGYQPFLTAASTPPSASSLNGMLLIDYDISRTKSASWEILITSIYPIISFSLLLMLFMGSVIAHLIDQPLTHLITVASRFAQGDLSAVAKLTGNSELASFAATWNQLLKQLAGTINPLVESKERLAVTLNSIGDGVIATDLNSRITFMNPVAQALTGWTMAEANDKLLTEVFTIVNTQTRKPAPDPVARTLSTGKLCALTEHTLLISRDAKEYHIADSAEPIRSQDGKLFGVVLVFRDVTAEHMLKEALSREKALLRCLIDAIPDLIFYKDINSHYIGCNKAFEKYTGRPEASQSGKSDFDFFDRHTAEHYRRFDLAVLASKHSRSNEEWITYPDGRCVLVDTIKTPFFTPEGQMLGLVGISRDITERKRIEEKLAASEERIRSLGNNLPNGYIYQCELTAKGSATFHFISTGIEKIHGLATEEILRNPSVLLKQIDAAQLAHYQEAVASSTRDLSDFSMELYIHTPAGNRWIQVCSRPKMLKEGTTIWDGIVLDITEKKLSEEQIWRQANFDPLTGLPNRRMFNDRLEQQIKNADRNIAAFALLFIDLDKFKEINDTLGHILGDKLLETTAKRIMSCVRDTDTVARLGGDEFTVILTDLEHSEDVERVAQSILALMQEPFALNDEQCCISASIGITIYPTDAADIGHLMQNADQAMYAAKNNGRNCYSYFTTAMQNAAQYRLSMTHDLRQALAKQQFQVYYQPIVDLKTGRIDKAEALIRWHHPTKGLINPASFIPVAEENGLIHEIGDWVFKQAILHVELLRKHINPSFQISINRSPIQFLRSEGSGINWAAYLNSLGMSGDCLTIDITEALLQETSADTAEKLLAYRAAGIQVAIDDFGTGYSSLSYMQNFNIDYLKIHNSFICNLTDNSTHLALCEAIILMAHKLGMRVVAEGIETQQQKDLLTRIGCDYGQGYLFSRPLPAGEFANLLKTPHHDK